MSQTVTQDHLDVAIVVQPSSVVSLNAFGTAFSWFLVYFFYNRYILERILPGIHQRYWSKMTLVDQRSFIVHHHWLTVKAMCIPGLWPYINIMFLGKKLAQPIFVGAKITNADFLVVLYMAIISSFAWEICYRCKISPVSLIHHAAAIVLATWQLAGDVASVPYTTVIPPDGRFVDTVENDLQFKIIITYGIFEVVFESWMHVCCILHRRFAGQHLKTAKLWAFGGVWVLGGSLAELGVMIYLWHLYWSKWNNAMRAIMIILHFAFMAAQLHGARIGILLVRKYRKKALEEARANADPEASSSGEVTSPIEAVNLEKIPSKSSSTKNEVVEAEQPFTAELLIHPLTESGVGDLEEEVSGR